MRADAAGIASHVGGQGSKYVPTTGQKRSNQQATMMPSSRGVTETGEASKGQEDTERGGTEEAEDNSQR